MKTIKYFLIALFAFTAMSCTDHILGDGGEDDDPIPAGGGSGGSGGSGGGGNGGGHP